MVLYVHLSFFLVSLHAGILPILSLFAIFECCPPLPTLPRKAQCQLGVPGASPHHLLLNLAIVSTAYIGADGGGAGRGSSAVQMHPYSDPGTGESQRHSCLTPVVGCSCAGCCRDSDSSSLCSFFWTCHAPTVIPAGQEQVLKRGTHSLPLSLSLADTGKGGTPELPLQVTGEQLHGVPGLARNRGRGAELPPSSASSLPVGNTWSEGGSWAGSRSWKEEEPVSYCCYPWPSLVPSAAASYSLQLDSGGGWGLGLFQCLQQLGVAVWVGSSLQCLFPAVSRHLGTIGGRGKVLEGGACSPKLRFK